MKNPLMAGDPFEGPTIHPTGECFNDALEFLEDGVKCGYIDPRDESGLLVHALCKMPDGTIFAHAWIEYGGFCIMTGLHENAKKTFAADRKEYYAYYDVQEQTKYTMREAATENLRTNNFGPWKQRYIDKCKDKQQHTHAPRDSGIDMSVAP